MYQDFQPVITRLANCKLCHALVIAVIAVGTASYWAITEQSTRTYDLDIDGWGFPVAKMQRGVPKLEALFTDPSLWKGPVVPFLFGVSFAVVPSEYAPLGFNVLCFGGSAALLYLSFRNLGASFLLAACSVICWILYPPYQYVFGYYYAEPVIALFSSLLFFAATRNLHPIPLGLIAGILLLVRAPFILITLAIPFFRPSHIPVLRWRSYVYYLIGLAAPVGLWTIRNLFVTGAFIPFTLEAGLVRFQGVFVDGDDARIAILRATNKTFNTLEAAAPKDPVERYRYWSRLAREEVIKNPSAQLPLLGKKILRFWFNIPPHSWIPTGVSTFITLLVLPAALLGFISHYSFMHARLCGLWIGGLWLFHSIIHSEMRYNFPILPMTFLLAGLGFSRLHQLFFSLGSGMSRSQNHQFD